MMLHLKTRVNRLRRSLKRLSKTHYPPFLFGRSLKKGDIPIFVYHDINHESFRRDLQFLRDNCYQTLTTREFIEYNEKNRNDRAVLLTFDDARRNFWQETFPLLTEFGAKATLFVPTHWIRSQNNTSKSVPCQSTNLFMTWDQLRICAQSGLVDVQSHGHRHALVYTSSRLITFASPRNLKHIDLFDWPMRHENNFDVLGYPPPGTPIYTAAPLLSSYCRMIENEEISQACRNAVRKQGEEDFFSQPKWMDCLHRIHNDMQDRSCKHAFITQEHFRALVYSEFQLSRDIFMEELKTPPRYLAFPWMLGSDLAMQYSADSGIEALFGVGLDYSRIKNEAGPLPAFYRIKGDWLRFLPGSGRQKWADILPEKIRGFLFSQHLAH